MAGKALTMVGEGLKVFAGSLAAVSALLAAAWWAIEPRAQAWVAQIAMAAVKNTVDSGVSDALKEIAATRPQGGPCAVFPISGHFIAGARPGQWGNVEWRDVRRLRNNCGVPVVTGVIVNGGGFLHDAPLSIRGVPMPEGVHDYRYRFFINGEVTPGRARFQVIVTYPDAVGGAPPAISPWLDFTISDPP